MTIYLLPRYNEQYRIPDDAPEGVERNAVKIKASRNTATIAYDFSDNIGPYDGVLLVL